MRKVIQRALNTTVDGQLACAFGEPWLGPHHLCAAATAAICGVPVSEVPFPDYSHLLPKRLNAAPVEDNRPLGQGSLF
jgi:hypothetical protein